jgi:hypothetical protein
MVSAGGLSRRPRLASVPTSRDGCGSIATTDCGSSPSESQPSSMALPILPAPHRMMVPVRPARVRVPDVVD